VLQSDIKVYKKTDRLYKKGFAVSMVLDQFGTLPYVIGGILLLSGGGTGYYWFAAAFLFSYAKAVLDAWVLLIEIVR
jgi:modulator of FtsH protease